MVPSGLIKLESATYGGNCGARQGNATAVVRKHCDGRNGCKFVVDMAELGDPANGCSKDFTVKWTCDRPGTLNTLTLPPEAGFKSVASLLCQTDPHGDNR
jgi:hypothetical protein